LDDAVVLAEGVSLPVLRQKQALHIGMPFKAYAEHVEYFPLKPVRRQVHADRGMRRFRFRNVRLDPDAGVSGEEPDNPAKFLYEKLGFTNKYLEMRLQR
jgi:hypothetical protein